MLRRTCVVDSCVCVMCVLICSYFLELNAPHPTLEPRALYMSLNVGFYLVGLGW